MKLSSKEIEQLMQTVADGWNEGDAHKSASCFSEDVVYVEPPDKQFYHGIVVMKVVSGLITYWREYPYRSELDGKNLQAIILCSRPFEPSSDEFRAVSRRMQMGFYNATNVN